MNIVAAVNHRKWYNDDDGDGDDNGNDDVGDDNDEDDDESCPRGGKINPGVHGGPPQAPWS